MHLALMSLNLGVVYTTNQDNVFELCCHKYGRSYKVIATLDDLSTVVPGDRVYVKFHGDLQHPASVVFTDADYIERTRKDDYFLDIRIKSDLLTKHFLFVGYSFRDPNIQQTFSSLNSIFKGKIPPAYFVPWSYDPKLEDLTAQYGVKVVNTGAIFPEAKSNTEAFDKFFIELANLTYAKKTTDQIEGMYDSKIPYSQRVVSKYDVVAIESSLASDDCATACHKFSAICDQALLPGEYEERIAKVLMTLASQTRTEQESDALARTLVHLEITEPLLRVRLLAAAFATANVRPPSNGIGDHFRPHMRGFPEGIHLFVVSQAISLLREWSMTVTEGFRSRVTSWLMHANGIDDFSSDLQQEIRSQYEWAWKSGKHTTLENPIEYMERLKNAPGRASFARTREQIAAEMSGMMPKTFKKPHEG